MSPRSPFNLLQGGETLPQRMDAPEHNGLSPGWLKRITYRVHAGLERCHHERAKRLPLGVGSVFSLQCESDRRLPAAWSVASSSVPTAGKPPADDAHALVPHRIDRATATLSSWLLATSVDLVRISVV